MNEQPTAPAAADQGPAAAGTTGIAGSAVIVTGAGGELGAGYVRAFAAAGAHVLATDLPDLAAAGRAAAAAGAAGGGRAVFAAGDVTSDDDWAALVARATAEFGRLDVLVNNAAVYQGLAAKRPLTEITVAEWDRVLAVNLRGSWQGVKAAAPVMAAAGGGRIVNVSSVVARTGAAGFAHYVASKAAVDGLTRAAARELGPQGIAVNGVAPGLVGTASSRALNTGDYLDAAARNRSIARPMAPRDLVGAVLWLASPAAAFVTGQTLVVDGGQVFA